MESKMRDADKTESMRFKGKTGWTRQEIAELYEDWADEDEKERPGTSIKAGGFSDIGPSERGSEDGNIAGIYGSSEPSVLSHAAGKYADLGKQIGALVENKNVAYGNSFEKVGEFFRLLYPHGIPADRYVDVLLIARIFDKLMRIANGAYEDSYKDIAGYALLGEVRSRS